MKFQQGMTTRYLTHEEEISLFRNYKNNECLKSAETLVVSNLRYVAKLARKMQNPKVDESDLFQEGVIGLMKAVKSFDLSYNIRLIAYAIPYIKSAMLECIIHHIGIIKTLTSKPHRKLFFNLNKLRGDNHNLTNNDVKRISKELNVSEFDVIDIDARLRNQDISIDMDSEYDISSKELENTNDTSYLTLREHDEKYNLIDEAIRSLNEREKYIFLSRNLTDDVIGLKELSQELNISMERVRRINQNAFEKVQKYVLNRYE